MSPDLIQDGAEHLKGCYDPSMIQTIRERAVDIYRQRDDALAAGRLEGEAERLQRRRAIMLSDILPEAETRLVAPLLDLARSYLGHEPRMLGSCYVRTVAKDGIKLDYHQDQTIVGQPLVNVWVPLEDCGRTSPGLEVVLGSHASQIDPAGIGENPVDRAMIDPAALSATPREKFWAPAFKAGDVIVFTGLTVHRSHVTPEMTTPRMSIEIRLI